MFKKGEMRTSRTKRFFQQKSPPAQWIYFGLPIWISFGGGHAGAAGGASMEHRTLTCKDDVHKLHKELYIEYIEYIDIWYPPPQKKPVCIQNHPLRCMYTESCLIFVQLWDIDGTLTTLPA